MRTCLVAGVIAAALSPLAHAEPVPVRLILESPAAIQVQVGKLLATPILVRIVRATDGLPVAGAKVIVAYPFPCGGFSECPETHGMFKLFDGISGVYRSPSNSAYTDCQGLARIGAFEAGTAVMNLPLLTASVADGYIDVDVSSTAEEDRTKTIGIEQVADAPILPVVAEPTREFCGAVYPENHVCRLNLLETGFEEGYCSSM